MSGECDRARQWASTQLDGELSSFERVLLHAHLDAMPGLQRVQQRIGGLTATLRRGAVQQLRARSRSPARGAACRSGSLRLWPRWPSPSVGLGSLLASSAVRSGSVGVAHAPDACA